MPGDAQPGTVVVADFAGRHVPPPRASRLLTSVIDALTHALRTLVDRRVRASLGQDRPARGPERTCTSRTDGWLADGSNSPSPRSRTRRARSRAAPRSGRREAVSYRPWAEAGERSGQRPEDRQGDGSAPSECQGVRIRGPSSVTATVNSKWAASEPSRGVDGPVVAAHPDLGRAGVDHRLDREHHARLQLRARARLAEVGDLRVLVHVAADAVPDQRADDREPLGLDLALDRVRDVAEVVAGPRLLDAGEQRRPGVRRAASARRRRSGRPGP